MFLFNVKLIFCWIILASVSCKVPYTNFQERYINANLLQSVPELISEQATTKSIRVYKATLGEYLVPKNGIEELQLTNMEETAVEELIAGRRHYLYLFYFITDPKTDIIMFLSTTYNRESINTRLGPGYLGYVDEKGFQAFYSLKIINCCNSFTLEVGKRFVGATKLFFDTDADLASLYGKKFTITKITNQKPNKIGDNKSVVYEIPVIFDSKNALLFKYDKTILINP